MRLTRQHHRKARLLWQAILVNGAPDTTRLRTAVRTVRQYEGRDTEAVLRCLARRLQAYIRATRIGVVSADPLSAQQQEQLARRFRGTGAANTGIRFSVEPAVAGGVRVEQGYQVTDLTIARQLEIWKDELVKS